MFREASSHGKSPMVQYRRDKTGGGTYFFTLVLKDRCSKLLTRYITLLRRCFRRAKKNNEFRIKALVILPDHLHMIMILPEVDSDYSTRIRQIKTYFVKELILIGEELIKNQRGEYPIWQRRFWEHRIRSDSDLQAHVDYIHFNPVKHRLAKQAVDWPYSSIHKYIADGMVPKNWGGEGVNGDFGE